MTNDWNNVKPVGCKPWLVLPAVYSDALSYGEQIAQFCSALNKVIENNNNLPSYVSQMIQEYISGGVIGEIVQNVIAQFILNVKYPPEGITPAVGDGSADDTAAVQGCIDYAASHNGMAVYFPSGAYSVQSLTLKSEVSLFGFDRYSTKLVLRGGATTPMVLLNGSDCGIYNLTLDGNAGVQVENVNVISMIAQDVLLDNLIIQNGYQLLVYNGTGGHLQINDVVFGNAVYRAVGISGNSIVQAKGLKFNQISAVSGVDVINISSDGGTYDFISDVPCETCLSISGNDNYVTGLENGATNAFVDSGLRNTIDFKGNERKEYYYGDSDTTIVGEVGFTTNSAYSENISGAYTSVRNSSESKVVTGASTEQYKSSQTENVTGKKTINAQDIQLNSTNPLQYKNPSDLVGYFNGWFKSIPFKGDNNKPYNVLVQGENPDFKYKNILWYGAIADGITDDSNAMTNALSGGGVLLLPPGTYAMRGRIRIPDNTTIIAYGATIIDIGDFSSSLFEIVGSNISIYGGIYTRNEELTTNNSTTSMFLVHDVVEDNYTSSPFNIMFCDIKIEKTLKYGINMESGSSGIISQFVRILNSVFFDVYWPVKNGGGFYYEIIDNCQFNNSMAENLTTDGDCRYIVINNCRFSFNKGGVGCIGCDGSHFVVINNCFFNQGGNTYTNANGITFNREISYCSFYIISNNTFADCAKDIWFRDSSEDYPNVGCRNTTVVNNQSVGTDQGIVIENLLSNNFFKNNYSANSAIYNIKSENLVNILECTSIDTPILTALPDSWIVSGTKQDFSGMNVVIFNSGFVRVIAAINLPDSYVNLSTLITLPHGPSYEHYFNVNSRDGKAGYGRYSNRNLGVIFNETPTNYVLIDVTVPYFYINNTVS